MSTTLALIAHDLKNALGALESELGLLSQTPSRSKALQAQQHCAELRQQFVQFLTLYSAESQGLRALCEDESPAALMAQLVRTWQHKLQTIGSPLQLSCLSSDAAPSFWYFDRRLVQLALDAAIHNATRFARSHIGLAVQQQGPWLCWSVQDDGPGLGSPDPDQPSATGLGSALALAVAQAHRLGGQAGHTRLLTPPQGGTRFELCLP